MLNLDWLTLNSSTSKKYSFHRSGKFMPGKEPVLRFVLCYFGNLTTFIITLVVPLFRHMEFVFSLIDKLNVGLHRCGLSGLILTTQLPCGTSSNKIPVQRMICSAR